MEIPQENSIESNASASVGSLQNGSEQFGAVPKTSESLGTIPNPSERVGTVPHGSETYRNVRNEAHTITVRDAARMFEAAGVARTERSIVKWCQPNAKGLARLDAFFDPNDRRYYITERSIQSAIAEEKAKAFRNVRNGTEEGQKRSESATETKNSENAETASGANANTWRKELLDLQILNAGKDIVIKQLREERDKFIQQLLDGSKKIGELETRLLQLGEASEKKVRTRSSDPTELESFGI